jgi:tetratricopeptide (TPR) repeat protein
MPSRRSPDRSSRSSLRSPLATSLMAAAASLALVLGAAPARADEPLADSYKLQTKNDLAGAVRAMREAVTAAPTAYFPRLRLAYLASLAADYATAADSYHAAARLAPGAVEPLLGEQLALISLTRWDDADTVGKAALALDPTSYLARSRLAWTRFKKKDFRGAAELYAAVLVHYPADVDMRLGLGWSLLYLGRKADAAAAFREVLTMVPKQAGALEGLAAAR